MKTLVNLTEQEKYMLLYKGSLISIPKDPEKRNFSSYYDDTIERIEYLQHSPQVYLRDGKTWYTVDKKDVPKELQEDFYPIKIKSFFKIFYNKYYGIK